MAIPGKTSEPVIPYRKPTDGSTVNEEPFVSKIGAESKKDLRFAQIVILEKICVDCRTDTKPGKSAAIEEKETHFATYSEGRCILSRRYVFRPDRPTLSGIPLPLILNRKRILDQEVHKIERDIIVLGSGSLAVTAARRQL
jgi:hypothetical protein